MKRIVIYFCVLALIVISISGCSSHNENGEYTVKDIHIFEKSEAWELAKAVNNNNTFSINKICKEHPEWVDTIDPEYGVSLLTWAVGMDKYSSVKALLENGADVDLISPYTGGTALFEACGFLWTDTMANKSPKYVKLLLEHGADPNICFEGCDKDNITVVGTSPLMESIGCGLEKTKLLIENGADIDYQVPGSLETAAIVALDHGGPNGTDAAAEYADYLINECGADISRPYYIVGLVDKYGNPDPENERMPIDILDRWTFKEGTYGYKVKLEILENNK